MEFNKLKIDIKATKPDTTRADDDKYFEIVVKKSCVEGVVRLLEGVFGPPAYPSRVKLSKEAQNAIKNFGGVRNGQTLYFLSKVGSSIFAMIWPWQDGERVTIKIGRV